MEKEEKKLEKEKTVVRKSRQKWDASLKWQRVTIKDEPVLKFEINGYPFFLNEAEENQLLQALKEINPTAHFIITSVTE